MTPRVALVLPGRGSYQKTELGSLAGETGPGVAGEVLAALDALRAARGEESLRALDGRERFSPGIHLRADHASELILAAAARDLDLVRVAEEARRLQVVCVLGNSLGFYLALLASEALSASDAARLVSTMGSLQVGGARTGGQTIHPVADPDTWAPRAERWADLEREIAARGDVWLSIRLGGIAVLAGEEAALGSLEAALEPVEMGGRRFPIRLAGHAAFHTPLLGALSKQAKEALRGLGFRAPRIPLIDGRGVVHRPATTWVEGLRAYTHGEQVTRTYDFTASLRVALREYAPDAIVITGPGQSLGAPVGQVLVEDRWEGISSKHAFLTRQASDAPIVWELGREGVREGFAERFG